MSFTKKKRKGVSYITRKKTASASESADEDEEEDESKGKKKKKGRGPSAFMVGDIETLPYHVETDGPKTHVAYAAGYMIVSPIHKTENGEVIGLPNKGDVNRFYSEDYIHLIGNFLDRSTKMLEEFMARVLAAGSKLKRGGAATLYFHNLSRFDGFILLRHLALQLELPYTIKPLVRNSMIYKIIIYIETGNPKKPEKLVLRIRDSCLLLPGTLADLADSFCPEAGGKGDVDHDKVDLSNLASHREEYLEEGELCLLIKF